METNIPTAEEFATQWEEDNFPNFMMGQDMDKVMVEFAKLHIKAALKAVNKKVKEQYMMDAGMSQSILTAYPEELIK